MTNFRKQLRSSEGRTELSSQEQDCPSCCCHSKICLAESPQEHGAKLRDALRIPGRARWDDPSQLPGKHLVNTPGAQGSGYPTPWPVLLHMKSRERLGATHRW